MFDDWSWRVLRKAIVDSGEMEERGVSFNSTFSHDKQIQPGARVGVGLSGYGQGRGRDFPLAEVS